MPEPLKSREDVELLSRGKTKILVVDDEEAIAEIMAVMLTSEGYFVETATNGDVAIDLYCQYLSEGQPFDFVLTGLLQPGMNGLQLIEAIQKKKRGQRFGFSTASPILAKPFEKSQLRHFVRS